MNSILTLCIKILVVILIIIAAIKILTFSYDSKMVSAAQDIIAAKDSQSATQMLKRIDSQQAHINKLTTYCIKYEVTPPVHLSDITSCRDRALTHLGLPNNLLELNKLSERKIEVSCSSKDLLSK